MQHENLFSIGEIAKSIGITRKIILNYEAKGLVKPDKKDGATGNRYYTIDTFTQIRTIRIFQNLGLSLDEIREYFNDTTELKNIIQRLENMRNELNLTIEKLKERACMADDEMKIISLDEQTVYCRNYTAVSVAEKTNLLRDTALEAMHQYGTDITKRMYYTQYPADAPHDVSYCVAVPPESDGEYIRFIPACKAISMFHHGSYEGVPAARERVMAYAKANDLKLEGTFRNIYLEGPPQHKDKSRFITQIIAILAEN